MNCKQVLATVALLVIALPMACRAEDDAIDDEEVSTGTAPAKTASAPVVVAATASAPAAKPATTVKPVAAKKAPAKPVVKDLIPTGNGKIETVSRNLPNFSGVYIRGNFIVTVKIGEVQQAKVIGDENLLRLVKTTVDAGRLDILSDVEYKSAKPIRVEVTTARISGIWIDGTANVEASDIKGDTVNCELEGSPSLKLSGSAMVLRLKLDGSSKLDASGLSALKVDVKTSDSSRAVVRASDRLKAVAFGTSHITYYGHMTVNQKTYGESVIKPAEDVAK